MIEFAAAQAKLAAVQPDGATLREHLQVVERTSGRTPPELIVPALPAGLEAVWDAFIELRGVASASGIGAVCITHGMIADYQAVYDVRLSPWEIESIIAMDAAVIAAQDQETNRGR